MFNWIKSVGGLAIVIVAITSAAPAIAGRLHGHHHHRTSFTEHHREYDTEPTHVRATPEPNESPVPGASAIVAPPPHDEETTHHTSKTVHVDKETKQKAQQKATSIFIDAKPNIALKLNARFQSLTKPEIEEIIRSEFAKASANTAKQVNSGVSFEILSGKLTIGASKTIGGVTVTFGELNVYKTSALIATSIIACKALVGNEPKECLSKALSKAESVVANEFMPETNAQARVMHETRTAEARAGEWPIYAVVAVIAAGVVGFIALFFKKHQSEEGKALATDLSCLPVALGIF